MGNCLNCYNSLYSILKRIFETMKSLFIQQHKQNKSLIESIQDLTKIETKLEDFEFYNYKPPIINNSSSDISTKLNESFILVSFSSKYNQETSNIKLSEPTTSSSYATSCISDDLISCSDEVIFCTLPSFTI